MRKGSQLPTLAQPYSSPYKVLEKGPKYFQLDISGKGTATAFTVDSLKPHAKADKTTPHCARATRTGSGQLLQADHLQRGFGPLEMFTLAGLLLS